MNKMTIILALVMLLALAVPLCTAREHQGLRKDDFIVSASDKM